MCWRKSAVLSLFVHEGETRTLTAKQEHILKLSEEKFTRKMYGARYGPVTVQRQVDVRRHNCGGDLQGTYCVGKTKSWNRRPLKVPRRRSRDNIKMNH